MLKNEVLNVDGTNWLVREAITRDVALETIGAARCIGSVGAKQSSHHGGEEIVDADVVRLHDDGRECLPYGEFGADHSALVAAASSKTTTPEHILKKLRQREGLEADDRSRDDELNTMPPMSKLRALAAWELGSPDWADQFVTWAKQCGIQITDPRA